ncbi:SRPBCC family protein [Streptomyces hoynatensis]|uniref:Cyclase n=1 Tax=Streptomyces hoynatensis TaxID=1141874 RepID=A0A3A9Z681_9ACTN|nr:SRPBCC family protein [Streptomyces hoynatensis]RKN43982.1 cyclase [Streptomyces hoynatensis]
MSRRRGGFGERFLTLVESLDVGVAVREAYGRWTRLQEFGACARGVQGVERVDGTGSDWRAEILWSTRSRQAEVTEQVPDERIAWTGSGAKGTTRGVVSFHPLGERLTRVLLVIEYHARGVLEKAGALWRAQGRRVRLDLRRFGRFVTLRGEATGEWRGEIREGEAAEGPGESAAGEEYEDWPEGEEPEEDRPERAAYAAGDAGEAGDYGEAGERDELDEAEEPDEDVGEEATAAGYPEDTQDTEDTRDTEDAQDTEAAEGPEDAAGAGEAEEGEEPADPGEFGDAGESEDREGAR